MTSGSFEHRSAAGAVACALLLSGCVSQLSLEDAATLHAASPNGALAVEQDGRARFRQVFCGMLASDPAAVTNDPGCEHLLWRLADEPPPAAETQPLPVLPRHLRILMVSGAFGDCRLEGMFPYGDEIDRLAATGLTIERVLVSGRSSAETNAGTIAAAIRSSGPATAPILLLGYSKGAVDILQFLVAEPDLARQVVAVVSIAGPIQGSPLAGKADWWYRTMFQHSFKEFCDPGDGGVIASLLPETRRQWLAEHPLPRHVRYFSLVAFPTHEHLSHGLAVPWHLLAETDRMNDGQVLASDALVPGSTLLGYVDADHWDVAIALDKQLPYLSARPSQRHFPRGTLLEAMLGYVGESLGANPSVVQ